MNWAITGLQVWFQAQMPDETIKNMTCTKAPVKGLVRAHGCIHPFKIIYPTVAFAIVFPSVHW